VIDHPPSVTLVVTAGDDLILVRQHRPGANAAVLELPAGKVEPGETTREAADRELAEECGLAVDAWVEIGSFWAAPGYSTERVTVFAGTCSGEADGVPDEDEEIAVVRVPAGEALTRLEDGISIAALALWLR
jgi:ADP-ribose pyrophosphatase